MFTISQKKKNLEKPNDSTDTTDQSSNDQLRESFFNFVSNILKDGHRSIVPLMELHLDQARARKTSTVHSAASYSSIHDFHGAIQNFEEITDEFSGKLQTVKHLLENFESNN